MSANLKAREVQIKALKESIVESVNKRVSETVTSISVRGKNLLLNDFEYAMGKIILESTPEGIGIGAHYSCNAKCIFCLGGKPNIFSLQRYKEFFEPKLRSVLSKARYVNFCGFGELLLMPDIGKFIDYTIETIPEINKVFTTNGTPLMNNKLLDLVTQTKSVIQISLHASNSGLHRLLTRMDTFDQIVSGIKQLVSMRKHKERPAIVLVFLVNALNIENLPEFVEFAARLGVDEVICSYMTVFHYAHLKLSCFFKQELTNISLKEAEEVSRKLNMPIKLPPAFGADIRTDKTNLCSDPWKYLYIENECSILPCCYAGSHIGYFDWTDFATVWNGSGYANLRRSLIEGPPHNWCLYCHKYRSKNINDIRSHINFRPGFRDKILKGCKL